MRQRTTILTVLAVIGLSPAIFAQHFPSPEEREKIRVKVGITTDQQNQIEAVFAEERRQEGESRKKMGELYKQLYTTLDVYDYDKSAANSLRKDICKLYRERLAIHAEAQEKLRRILNKDQFEKMTALAREQHEAWKKRMEEQRKNGVLGHPGPPPGPGTNL